MKRKYFFVILFLIFAITNWEQDNWCDVEAYYTIKNTGNVTIDYYEVYFKAKCSDGSVYQDFDNGLNVKVGDTLSDHTYILTPSEKYVVSVYVSDHDLTNYNYLWSY